MLTSRWNSIPRFALPYSSADFTAGLLAILRGGPPPEAFGMLGDSPKFWTRSGRQALSLLLQALDLKAGSGVALPLFTDPSLVRAIVAAGHHPVFVDIDPHWLTMDPAGLKAKRQKFSALVAVHLFGQLADMPAILDAAGGAPVIEDTAHAPLSYLNGRMAGKFGIASFYSFASTKYWPAGGGGLAVVHDAALAERFSKLSESLRKPNPIEDLRNVLLFGTKAAVFTRQWYGVFGEPMRRWVEAWGLLEPHLDMKSIAHSQAAVAVRQAEFLPQRVEEQRANSLRLLSHLEGTQDLVLPHERPGARYSYHLFPVLVRNPDERAAVRAAMWSKFVDTSVIYSHVVRESRQFGYGGGCPVAESVADRIMTLPNYAVLTSRDIDDVGFAFLSSLRTYRNSAPRCHSSRLVPTPDAISRR